MHIIQINPLRPKPPESLLALLPTVRRRGIDLDPPRGRIRLEPELGREEYGRAPRRVRCEPFAEEDFGVAVGRGCVPEGEAEGVCAGEEGEAGGVGSV